MVDSQSDQDEFQDTADSVPGDIISQLFASGTEWMNGQEQEDDISLLVLKFK